MWHKGSNHSHWNTECLVQNSLVTKMQKPLPLTQGSKGRCWKWHGKSGSTLIPKISEAQQTLLQIWGSEWRYILQAFIYPDFFWHMFSFHRKEFSSPIYLYFFFSSRHILVNLNSITESQRESFCSGQVSSTQLTTVQEAGSRGTHTSKGSTLGKSLVF